MCQAESASSNRASNSGGFPAHTEPSMMRNAPDAATAEEVAAELVAAVHHHEFVTFASPRELGTAESKAQDVNGFLAVARERLAVFR